MRSLSPHACGPRLISSIPISMLLDGSRAWVHAYGAAPLIGALDFFPTLRPARQLGVCEGSLIRRQRPRLLSGQGLLLDLARREHRRLLIGPDRAQGARP